MKKYLKMAEVVKITGFHRLSIIRHVNEGNLKCYKPKGSQEYRFTEKQIEDFVTSGSPAGR